MSAIDLDDLDPSEEDPERYSEEVWIQAALDTLHRQTIQNGGTLPYGAVPKMMKKLETLGIMISYGSIHGKLQRLRDKKKFDDRSFKTFPMMEDGYFPIEDRSRGRPIGSTEAARAEYNMRLFHLRNEIVKMCMENKTQGMKYPFSESNIQSVINWQKNLHNMPSAIIPVSTIKTRLSRDDQDSIQYGPEGPLAEVEPHIVDILIAAGRMNMPFSVGDGIEMINGLIDGTRHATHLFVWKCNNGHRHQESEEKFKIGRGYWNGLMSRFKPLLVTKKGKVFPHQRDLWNKKENLEIMYENIYDSMVEAGVAKYKDQPSYQDMEGNDVVHGTGVALGEMCTIDITHPQYILFADETGCNTNQRNDGHEGGRKYVVQRGTSAKNRVATDDIRYTLLPIIAGTGEPVCFVVIFAGTGNNIPAQWVSGIDPRPEVTPIKDKDGNITPCKENCGPGRMFPHGHICTFRNKKIEPLYFMTPNGSINADILTSVLSYLDDLQVYQRGEGCPNPMLIVDGHESRMSPKFIRYINQEETKWFVNIGVPYLTHLWQIADSPALNGTFKISWVTEKRKLIQFRRRMGQPARLYASDIIPLLNRAIKNSFLDMEKNKKVIAQRGWIPANRNLILERDFARNTMAHTGSALFSWRELAKLRAVENNPEYDNMSELEMRRAVLDTLEEEQKVLDDNFRRRYENNKKNNDVPVTTPKKSNQPTNTVTPSPEPRERTNQNNTETDTTYDSPGLVEAVEVQTVDDMSSDLTSTKDSNDFAKTSNREGSIQWKEAPATEGTIQWKKTHGMETTIQWKQTAGKEGRFDWKESTGPEEEDRKMTPQEARAYDEARPTNENQQIADVSTRPTKQTKEGSAQKRWTNETQEGSDVVTETAKMIKEVSTETTEKVNNFFAALEDTFGLNLTNGEASTIIHTILKEAAKCKNLIWEDKKEQDDYTAFMAAKKLTSGLIYRQSNTSLNHPALVQAVFDWEEKKEKKAKEAQLKHEAKWRKVVRDVADLRKRKQDDKDFTAKDLRTIIQYKKRKGDEAMPLTTKALRERYEEIKNRRSPSPPRDEENESEEPAQEEVKWAEV